MDSIQNYNIRRYLKKFVANVIFFMYRLQTSHSVDKKRHGIFIGECTYSPWLIDEDFKALQVKIKGFTLVDENKQYLTYSYIKQLSKLGVKGDYLEVGVWRGGLSALIGMTFKKYSTIPRKLFLADTYEGMPKTVKEDNFYKGGELSDTSAELVKGLMDACELKNTFILKGYFPDQTQELIDSNSFAYVHIDVDIYESAKNTFDWVWPLMSTNGMVVFDDYGYSSTEGVTLIVDEYISKIPDAMLIFNMGGQALVIKTQPQNLSEI